MASRSLGTLTLDLIAKVGGFEQGMDKAARISEKRLKQIATQASALGNTIGTYLTRGIDSAVRVLGELFDAASGFQDLAEKVGDTAEAVASLKAASDVSNVSLDTVAAASIKLTAALSKVDDESKGVGQALAAIGLGLEDFKKLSPVEQIDAVAKALNRFEDGASKTAVAVALFGKSGAELIPFLNDLADGAERQITLTQEQIDAADEFSKAIDRTKGEVNTFALQIAGELVPTLNTTLSIFKDLISEVGSFGGNKKIVSEWAENAVIAFATVAEAVVGLIRALRAVGGSFESFFADLRVLDQINPAATIKSFVLGEGNDLEKAFAERQRIAAEANQRYIDLWNYSGTAVTDSLRRAFNEQKGIVDQSAKLLSSVTNSLPSGGSGIPFRPGVTQTEQAIPFRPGLGPQTRQQLDYSAAVEKTEKSTKKAAKATSEWDEILELHKKLQEEEEERQEAVNDKMKEAAQVYEATRSPLEKFNAEIQRLNELRDTFVNGKPLIDQQTYTRAVIQAQESLDEVVKGVEKVGKTTADTTDDMSVYAEQAARNIQDMFADFLFDPFSKGLDGMLTDFANMLQKMAAQAAAQQILGGLLSLGSGGFLDMLSGFGSSFGSSNFGGPMASGGPVQPGKAYIVGEDGPEWFMPKSSGSILPNGTAPGNVVYNINIPLTAPTGSVNRQTLDQISSAALSGAQRSMARNR